MNDAPVLHATLAGGPPIVSRTSRDRKFDRVRWVLIASWLVVLVSLPFAAERSSSWGHLKALVASGEVTRVEVNGELGPGSVGYSMVDLHWRHHGLNFVARVVQVRGRLDEDSCMNDDACFEASTTLHSVPSERLLELKPELVVTRHSQGRYRDDRLLGFSISLPLVIAEGLFGLVALLTLVGGPQPWRATRWAWWWWFTNPVGMAAFLLLSGPVPGLPAPRNADRRLTGGWSFILMMIVSSVSISAWRGMGFGIT